LEGEEEEERVAGEVEAGAVEEARKAVKAP
jgi:hypothetical protein